MKALRRRSTVSLDDRLAALGEAAELAAGRLNDSAVELARTVVDRAGTRAALSPDHTVCALAGATGSGKSSLFNALAGTELAQVGVTRPTTAHAQAARWDPEGSGPLLDWLEVPRRHTVDPRPGAHSYADDGGRTTSGYGDGDGDADGGGRGDGGRVTGRPEKGDDARTRDGDGSDLSGLVLLDLPDHDSIEVTHRLEVDRLVAVVDLLVWVLDPQKYADAAVHERYLRPLVRHKDVMVIVLNQVDRLPDGAVARCLDDLQRLLTEDGLAGVPVVAMSARTGRGLPELRGMLAERVSRRRLWAARLAADARTAADRLAEAAALTGSPAAGRRAAQGADALTAALSQAAGVPTVVAAVAKAHRHRAVVATGWPVTRWLRRLRPDPLRRLRLGDGASGRTSLPAVAAVSAAERSSVEVAVRDAGATAAEGVPEPWARAVREAARARQEELADALDGAVAGAVAATSLGAAGRPRWWTLIGVLQWLIFGAMAAGALWLFVLFLFGYFRLPEPPTPKAGAFPWPTLLFLGGVLAGLVVAALSRGAAWLGGHRRAKKAARALRAAVADVGTSMVLEPAEAERGRFTEFATRLTAARAP